MSKYFKNKKFLLSITIFFITSTALFNTLFAFVLKNLGDVSSLKNLNNLGKNILFALIFLFILMILEFARKIMCGRFVTDVMFSLKNDLIKTIVNNDEYQPNEQNASEYLSLITNDMEILEEDYFTDTLDIIQASIQVVFALTGLLTLSMYIGFSILIICMIPIFIPRIFEKIVSHRKKKISDNLSTLVLKSKDIFGGMETIKNFKAENVFIKNFSNRNKVVEDSKLNYVKIESLVNILCGYVSYTTYIAIVGIGAYLIIKGQATIGTFVAATYLADALCMPILNLAYSINTIKSIKLVKNKVELIFNGSCNNKDRGFNHINTFEKDISLENVSFRYDDKYVINDITLRIKKNEKIAIVGKSGSGKTTLINLIQNYYKDYEGSIKIDDISINKISKSSLRKNIATINQNVYIFDGTIKDNITLFLDYPMEKVLDSIEKANLKSFIDSLELGLDTYVGENGCNLSGGEKQRIALARVFLVDSQILILDEATSALDNYNSSIIDKNVIKEPITVISIIHKLQKNNLMYYDKIVFLESGVIKESGSFNELINLKQEFYNFFYHEEKL